MPLTVEQMDEWQIPWMQRDYCVDKLLEYRKCLLKTVYNDHCMHDKHVYHQCQYLEYVPSFAAPLLHLHIAKRSKPLCVSHVCSKEVENHS